MAPDFGVDWRQQLTPKLEKLDIKVQDPIVQTLKRFKAQSMEESRETLQRLWKEDRGKHHQIIMAIKRADIKAVLRSDFLITYWDWRITTYGTVDENREAAKNKIPIYCVCYAPAQLLPNWFIDDILYESGGGLFDSFDRLENFLKLRRNVILQQKRKALGF